MVRKFIPVKSSLIRHPNLVKMDEVVDVKPLRKSLQPGTIVIIVGGSYRGMRAVVLKRIEDGPYAGSVVVYNSGLDRVPSQIIHQDYLIATKASISSDAAASTLPSDIGMLKIKTKFSKEAAHQSDPVKRLEFLREELTSDHFVLDKAAVESINKAIGEVEGMDELLKNFYSLHNTPPPHRCVY